MSSLPQFVTYCGVTTNDKVTKTWILIQCSFPRLVHHVRSSKYIVHTIHIFGILCTLCDQCILCISRPKNAFCQQWALSSMFSMHTFSKMSMHNAYYILCKIHSSLCESSLQGTGFWSCLKIPSSQGLHWFSCEVKGFFLPESFQFSNGKLPVIKEVSHSVMGSFPARLIP